MYIVVDHEEPEFIACNTLEEARKQAEEWARLWRVLEPCIAPSSSANRISICEVKETVRWERSQS